MSPIANGVVKIFLAPEAKMPRWIMARLEENTDCFSIELEDFGRERVRVLTLVGGEASFSYPTKDDVRIKLPGVDNGWSSGFEPQAVLQITSGDGAVVEQNRLLCPKCLLNTGKVLSHVLTLTEDMKFIYECANPICREKWEFQLV